MQAVKRDHIVFLIRLFILFIAYFFTAKLGLGLDAVSGYATLVWPPTGIALAALILFGRNLWPAVALAAFAVNFSVGAPILVAIGISIGNTLEALLGAYVLKRYIGFSRKLERVKDVIGLVIIAAALCTMVSATIGVTSLFIGGIVSTADFAVTWIAWWIGDMLGALVIAPLILVWSSRLKRPYHPKRIPEAILFLAILIILSFIVFRGLVISGIETFAFAYLIFPILILISLRFGQLGSVTAIFVMAVVAIWTTITRYYPFNMEELSTSLLLLQRFVGITAITFMVMAAVVAERERTDKRKLEIQQRASVLASQRLRLEALNKTKDEFISLASHQLRTPATGVKLYLEMLLDNFAGPLKKPQRELLSIAAHQNDRQIQIINDLLDVAQLDMGSIVLKKEKSDVSELVDEAVTLQSKRIEQRGQTIAVKKSRGNYLARVDKHKIIVAIENLIENASKYSPQKTHIAVGIKRKDKKIHVSVKDQGIGIAKNDMPKLFKKFSRIKNSQAEAVDGNGIGLYWTKKIVSLHGGEIKAESKLGHGSEFILTLVGRTGKF